MKLRCFFGHKPKPITITTELRPLDFVEQECARCGKVRHVYKFWRTHWRTRESFAADEARDYRRNL